MDKVTKWKVLLRIIFLVQLLYIGECSGKNTEIEVKNNAKNPATVGEGVSNDHGIRVNASGNQVTLDNGIVQVMFAVPEGYVTGIRFGGIDNVLDATNRLSDRGYDFDANCKYIRNCRMNPISMCSYWDIASMSNPDNDDSAEIRLIGTSFKVITQTPEKVEISFLCPRTEALPLQADVRYVLLKGRTGYYSYAILERASGWAPLGVDQIRTVYKPNEKFPYMAVSDKIQRMMPMMRDRETGRPLSYKEAVLLTNPVDPKLRGQVDDKYQYALEDKDNKVHGWVSLNPGVGIWVITPTDEFRMGGPHKQDLTSHVGPTLLSMFHSTHYGGNDLVMRFKNGEPWKKVFGPYLVHLNSMPGQCDPRALWKQAQEQLLAEVKSWPYDFPESPDFDKANQRGSVVGRLLVKDGANGPVPAKIGWVGLSPPGEAGSWQYQMKGYQFWVQTDVEGRFMIPNVCAGEYNLFAWVPGYIGDFRSAQVVNMVPGKQISLGDQMFTPPRSGPTLWEIGFPDRSAAEFFVPDPIPEFTNPTFLNDPENKYRQYGLWDRYTDLYPKEDLSYTVGVSDYKKHWFFAHVLRKVGEAYQPTTWQIRFPLKEVLPKSNYTLQIALASASQAELQVRINNPEVKAPLFTSLLIGRDNAVARHGIHGLYRLFTIGVPSELLKIGDNTIYLRQTRSNEKFRSVMYDYLRLEGPSSPPK